METPGKFHETTTEKSIKNCIAKFHFNSNQFYLRKNILFLKMFKYLKIS